MKIWDDKEVKALFSKVENLKQNKEPIVLAFSEHAKLFSRKPNSVRNYYYHEVDNLCSDQARAKKLGIDLSKHNKTHFKNFDKVQEGDLFGQIDKMTSRGISVRAACLKLSGGDLNLMTRYQNKYQNMKRKLVQKQKSTQKPGDIIPFRQTRQTLSDSDLNSLFLGLVKLIKKNAQEEVLQKISPNEFLKNTLASLSEKTAQVTELKSQLEDLKNENKRLETLLKTVDKQSALKQHVLAKRSAQIPNKKRV